MSSSLPETIGKFHILQAIGEGGMGRLFLGRDPDLGSLVAIKLLREGFDNAELRERFTREASSGASVAGSLTCGRSTRTAVLESSASHSA
jgi:eukaryotic-like serine/threonine-protein kinase